MRYTLFVFTILYPIISCAQLSFCQGNTGLPIFEEDFGQGLSNGPALDTDFTNYIYVEESPQDGQYTISSDFMQLPGFHNIVDNSTDTNGRALIVNASFEAGLFFQTPIGGLCENNAYEFSAYVVNLFNVSSGFCPGTGIPVNVKFQIWDETDTILLAEGDTGDINGSVSTPSWQQYGLTFNTLAEQTKVILKMLNNGNGGCGNDLAIDDIVFRSCGDLTEILNDDGDTSSIFCADEDQSTINLTAVPDFSVYSNHFYQWQTSEDGINWVNIEGQTSDSISVGSEGGIRFYRVLVAQDSVNVNNIACNSISNIYEINEIDEIFAISLGDVAICLGELAILAVENNAAIRVDWYDAYSGGNLLLEDSFTFTPINEGIYYVESTSLLGSCVASQRTPIVFTILENIEDETELINICEGESIVLNADTSSLELSYLWSTDEETSQITVNEAGTYTVIRETSSGCTSSKTYMVSFIETAILKRIESKNSSIVIELENEGDFQFSLDGINYQNSSVFKNISGGFYNIYIKSESCGVQIIPFAHLVIPSIFTPNNDGINDYFRVKTDVFFDKFCITIFDRYGKIIVSSSKAPFIWDGTYKGVPLPSQDYWYRLMINGEFYTGNITLKR